MIHVIIPQSHTTQAAEICFCKRISNFLLVIFQALLEADGHPQIKAEESMNFIVIASQAGLVQV